MTTSGTLNETSLTIIDLIEKSIRKCGITPGLIGSEQLLSYKNELSILIAELTNEGVPLWTIEQQIVGLRKNQYIVNLPIGTIDVRNVLRRVNVLPSGGLASSSSGTAANAFDADVDTACTQTSTNGNIHYCFTSPVVITTVGLLPNSTGTLAPVYEYSSDGATWYTAITAPSPSTFTAGTWYWQDVENPVEASYFRIRETGGGTLDVAELVFSTSPSELPISKMNQDDYQNLPNKFVAGLPLQYWVDKQLEPRLRIWRASDSDFYSLALWTRRVIQDLGDFSNTLEFPTRWYNAIILLLASRICLEIPGIDPRRIDQLSPLAEIAKSKAFVEERDGGVSTYTPNIRGYTR